MSRSFSASQRAREIRDREERHGLGRAARHLCDRRRRFPRCGPSGTITACAPAASATRRQAPRLCGSVTPSSTSSSAGSVQAPRARPRGSPVRRAPSPARRCPGGVRPRRTRRGACPARASRARRRARATRSTSASRASCRPSSTKISSTDAGLGAQPCEHRVEAEQDARLLHARQRSRCDRARGPRAPPSRAPGRRGGSACRCARRAATWCAASKWK